MGARLPRTFWWLWTGALISALATFVFPFLALYLSARGFSPERVGLLVSLMGAGALLAGPFGGALSDRLGRRPTALVALLGSAAAAAFLAFVRAPLLIAPGVLAFGLFSTSAFPTLNATVADLVPAAEVQRAYGLLYWAQNLGIGVSALAGGMLATKSWTLLFLADAATTLVFAALVWHRVPESRPAHSGRRGFLPVLRDRALVGLLIAQIGFGLVFFQFQFALPIAMQRNGLGAAEYGRALAANCILILVLQPLLTPRLARLPPARVLAAGVLVVATGYFCYAFCRSGLSYVLVTLLWSVGEVIVLPPASALVAALAPDDLRGSYQGAFSLTFSCSTLLAPLVGGAIIGRAGLSALWGFCLAMGVVIAALHVALGVRRGRAGARAGV